AAATKEGDFSKPTKQPGTFDKPFLLDPLLRHVMGIIRTERWTSFISNDGHIHSEVYSPCAP
ncbi:hypothetical protein AB9E07_35590, partial [Rhizobium leguminosarum]